MGSHALWHCSDKVMDYFNKISKLSVAQQYHIQWDIFMTCPVLSISCSCHSCDICNIVSQAMGLTHWGRVTYICVGNLTITGWDNGLSPGRRQAIILTNDGRLSIGPLGTNFNEILIGILTFSLTKMHFKVSFVKWRPFCLGLYVLRMGYQEFGLDLQNPTSGRNLWCYDDCSLWSVICIFFLVLLHNWEHCNGNIDCIYLHKSHCSDHMNYWND